MDKYTVGLDFGTLSGRAVIVRNRDGQEMASKAFPYPHGVITGCLSGAGIALPDSYALQDPRDYMEAVPALLREVIRDSGIAPEDITAIGVDATATTMLPLDENMQPLCLQERFRTEPHAYIKLWKHHGAQKQADRINRLAAERKESFLRQCGGQVSAEWFWPKVMEIYTEAPDVYRAAACYVELGDWIAYLLTGERKRSPAIAVIHAQWNKAAGYPSGDFWQALEPGLLPAVRSMSLWPVQQEGACAGQLTREMAGMTGLLPETRVSLANTDSPIALFSLGIQDEGTAALVVGTSSVMLTFSRDDCFVPGAMVNASDILLPGLTVHMFGQSAVGDVFQWFAEQLLPYADTVAAQREKLTPIAWLNKQAAQTGPSGIVSLEWLNGCRFLQNMDFRGTISGITLQTTAAMIYRSLVEATAFGLKIMLDTADKHGVPVRALRACGGIAQKSPEIMQIYADILEREITVTSSGQENAHGSAIYGAVAAGREHGGYDSLTEAIPQMQCAVQKRYVPDSRYRDQYRQMYAAYQELITRMTGDQQP